MSKNGSGIYVLGILLGLVAGFVDVKFGDLLLTALFVLAATMVTGALRPERPWRWTLLVAVFVPVAQGVAYLLRAAGFEVGIAVQEHVQSPVKVRGGTEDAECGQRRGAVAGAVPGATHAQSLSGMR